MGRLPIISRRAILQAALQIVDDEGIDAVTSRRLGHALGVNGTSLYHHFSSMDEILGGVAALVLERNAPLGDDAAAAAVSSAAADWHAPMLRAIHTYRACLLEHPNAALLMLRPDARRYSVRAWALGAQVLLEAGLPERYVLVIMEQLEVLAVSSVLFSAGDGGSSTFEDAASDRRGEPYDSLRAAMRARDELAPDEAFELACRALLEGVSVLLGKATGTPPARGGPTSGRRSRRRTRSSPA